MALTDVIDRLAEVNEEQLVETKDIRIEMESLTDRVTDLLELNKQDRLDRLESLREGAGAFEAPSLTGGDAGAAAAGGQRGLGGLIGSLGGLFGLTGFLTSLTSFSRLLLTLFKGVGKFLGPIGLIITAIIGSFVAIEAFMEEYNKEGNILNSLEEAVKAFYREIVAMPLDLVKDTAAWLADQLGFKLTAQALREFSFAELYDDMITGIFDGLQNVTNLVKDIFHFPEDGEELGLQNFGNLLDTVMLPINAAINYAGGIFGFIEPTDEPFRLSNFVSSNIKAAMNHSNEVFGFEPVDTEKNLMDFLTETYNNIFASIEKVVTDFGNRLLIEGEIVFRRILTFIQNVPDQLMKFISDTLSFKLPPIIIPNPIPKAIRPPGMREDGIVLFEGTDEIRIPGGENAAANIAERNANLAADIDRIRSESDLPLADVQGIQNQSGMAVQQLNEETIRKVEIQRQQIQTGMAVQQLNAAAGASGGGTTIVYQTTNNVSGGGGGGGGATAVNAGSSSSAPSNDYHGTLDATQVIGGAPNR